jgi:hypothetical protein
VRPALALLGSSRGRAAIDQARLGQTAQTFLEVCR